MGTPWLADADPETSWANQAWTDFASLAQPEYAVVVLPVHTFRRRGDRPADIEELRGSVLLRAAVELVKRRFVVRVLPPLRFCPDGGPDGIFGIDAETAQTLVAGIAADVKAAGFRKLVLFGTSPGLVPFLATAALDARTELGLRPYVIHGVELGLDLERDEPGADPGPAARLASLLAEIREHLAPAPSESKAPAAPSPGPAAQYPAYRDRYLGAMSARQLAGIGSLSRALVVVPAGAIEQHGPHLPVGVDAILGQAVLTAALDRVPASRPVFVSPAITFGKSTEHRGFPGTVSISTTALRRLAMAIAGQVGALGVRRLVFYNTHGGNRAVLESAIGEIRETLGLDATEIRPAHAPELPARESAWGFHGGERETSIMQACAPELVHMDRAVAEYPFRPDDPGELRPARTAATFAWMTRDLSRSRRDRGSAARQRRKRQPLAVGGGDGARRAPLLASGPRTWLRRVRGFNGYLTR